MVEKNGSCKYSSPTTWNTAADCARQPLGACAPPGREQFLSGAIEDDD